MILVVLLRGVQVMDCLVLYFCLQLREALFLQNDPPVVQYVHLQHDWTTTVLYHTSTRFPSPI